jgi:hypothetical protein
MQTSHNRVARTRRFKGKDQASLGVGCLGWERRQAKRRYRG